MKHVSEEKLLEAIRASKEKWIGIQNALRRLEMAGAKVCPLCDLFTEGADSWDQACRRCPVKPRCWSERSLLEKWDNAILRAITKTVEIIDYLNRLEVEVQLVIK